MGEWATHHDNFDQSEEPITPTRLHQHFPTVQIEPNSNAQQLALVFDKFRMKILKIGKIF